MMDKKIKLMRDIAQEFSVEWDSKVFEQKMSIPALPERVNLAWYSYSAFNV